MLYREAVWIERQLNRLHNLGIRGTVVNLGSSSSEFINESQPYIREKVQEPAKRIGQVYNIDIKTEDGVDLVADFMTDDGYHKISQLQGKVFVVCNLLEHVTNPILAVNKIHKLMPKGSYLVFSGPRRYPYHPDPIDNRFRPNRKSLRKIASGKFEIIELDIVRGGSVLTCTTADPKIAYRWAINKFKFNSGIESYLIGMGAMRNSVRPASAICALLKKL
jgi:hypothetical protein